MFLGASVSGVALLFLVASLTRVGSSTEIRIHNASHYINTVNSLVYGGTTVYLESDLDFSGGLSEQFDPKDKFVGVFNGQEHTISNLNVNFFPEYVGPFQQATRATTKNVVIDSSCSSTGIYSTSVPEKKTFLEMYSSYQEKI